jgi:hypothetical protein
MAKNDALESTLIILGGFVGVALLIIYGGFVGGYVLLKFWNWFLLPVFPQMVQINIYQAVGLTYFVVVFKKINHNKMTLNDHEIKVKTDWAAELLTPWLLLLFGWLMHLLLVALN